MRRVALLVALAALAALPASAAAQAPPTAAPGVLTVGLNMPSDAFQVGAASGSRVVLARGLEVDLARAIARGLGLRPAFVQEPRFTRLVAPGAKAWDIALAQVTITAGRRRAVDFSAPYLTADEGVLLRRGLGATPGSLAELRGLALCAQRGTTGAAIVARRIAPAAAPRLFADQARMLQALQGGACDAVVLDAPVLASLRAEVPERYGPFAGVIRTGERYGVVLPEGSALTPRVNRALSALESSGRLEAIVKRWLTVDLASLPVLG
jgi:polar amino acid transport system substrate-binding protein